MNFALGKYILSRVIVCSCDNHFMPEAKTPHDNGRLVIEFKAEKGHENKMFKDEREKERERVLQKDLDWEADSDDDYNV